MKGKKREAKNILFPNLFAPIFLPLPQWEPSAGRSKRLYLSFQRAGGGPARS